MYIDKNQKRLYIKRLIMIAGWSSLVARWAHNPKVVGSNPTPATIAGDRKIASFFMAV